MQLVRTVMLSAALLLAATTIPSRAQTPIPAPVAATKAHKLAIQVSENKPEVMALALNNAQNVLDYYKAKGEMAVIEIVAYGPGLHMLRDDTSTVKARIAAMSLAEPSVTFMACENTRTNQSKQEGKAITLISEAKSVTSGVVRLIERQAEGYAYIKP